MNLCCDYSFTGTDVVAMCCDSLCTGADRLKKSVIFGEQELINRRCAVTFDLYD